jgi:hypothetical protein
VDEDQAILPWATALIWAKILQMGYLDLLGDTRYDCPGAYLRDIQQLPLLQ